MSRLRLRILGKSHESQVPESRGQLAMLALEVMRPVSMQAVRRQAAKMRGALARDYGPMGAKRHQEMPRSANGVGENGTQGQRHTLEGYDVARATDPE